MNRPIREGPRTNDKFGTVVLTPRGSHDQSFDQSGPRRKCLPPIALGFSSRFRKAPTTRTANTENDRPEVSNTKGNNAHPTTALVDHVVDARPPTLFSKAVRDLVKFINFIGPGAMVSVAYIDPGNYATDVAAGATYRFKLLFVVLLSNIFAIFLQNLCIKLGSVTGLNLAQMIKLHFPPWLNYSLYFIAEAAIIATDVAEVIGTAIALNLLFHIPLVAGCIISILDVLIILFFYRPGKSIKAVRAFEMFVLVLVLGVVVCFCYQLSLIEDTSVAEVFRGYLPSSALVQSQGYGCLTYLESVIRLTFEHSLYQACGILGATVMPHSLYLGSGMCQPRLLHFDKVHGNVPKDFELNGTTEAPAAASVDSDDEDDSAANPQSSAQQQSTYVPSLAAITHCLYMSTYELTFCLLTFALFVNSAILIVAGASLYSPDPTSASAAANASLFQIHTLLSQHIAPAAGTLFALALLLSGISAGIVCTIAGQLVSEAQLHWKMKPWVRRLLTRSVSVTPSVIIAGAVGAPGLTKALEASQVVLCFCLPAVVGPLVWFTARAKFLGVKVDADGRRVGVEGIASRPQLSGENVALTDVRAASGPTLPLGDDTISPIPEQWNERPQITTAEGDSSAAALPVQQRTVQFRNHPLTTGFAVLVWLVIVIMNGATIVLLGIDGGLQ